MSDKQTASKQVTTSDIINRLHSRLRVRILSVDPYRVTFQDDGTKRQYLAMIGGHLPVQCWELIAGGGQRMTSASRWVASIINGHTRNDAGEVA